MYLRKCFPEKKNINFKGFFWGGGEGFWGGGGSILFLGFDITRDTEIFPVTTQGKVEGRKGQVAVLVDSPRHFGRDELKIS